jgi:two-component system KDP operon response regulator KdpE
MSLAAPIVKVTPSSADFRRYTGRLDGGTAVNLQGRANNSQEELPMTRKVLVVDDDVDVREAVVDVLEEAGYAVEIAVDGREALQRLQDDGHPAALVVDSSLREATALAILRTCGETATLLITSGDEPPDWARARHPVLRKPFAGEELLAALARAIRERSAL